MDLAELLTYSVKYGASDLHLEPIAEGYEVRHRVDGLLKVRAKLDAGQVAANGGIAAILVLLWYMVPERTNVRLPLASHTLRHCDAGAVYSTSGNS